MSKTLYYISSGRKNGYFTLRTQWKEGQTEHDNYVMILNRDPEKSIKKARDYLAASSINYTLDETITCELSDIEKSKDWSWFRGGKHEGKTVDWVVENDFDYATWAAQNMSGKKYDKTIDLLLENPVIKELAIKSAAAAKYAADEGKKIIEEQAVKDAALKHVGTIGEKIELNLKVVAHVSGEGAYGTWNLTIMETEEGHKCIWWNFLDSDKGKMVKVKATVKNHEIRSELPHTVLSRVKLV